MGSNDDLTILHFHFYLAILNVCLTKQMLRKLHSSMPVEDSKLFLFQFLRTSRLKA